MQKGSLVRRVRHSQSAVWEFRWREPGPTGTRRHRRIVVGSTDEITDESEARQAVAALQIEINPNLKLTQPAITIGDLVRHFRQRELRTDFAWRTFSTRTGYEGNLRKWIVPRWSEHPTKTLKAGEVELWLRSLPLARASCAKIRNLMSMLFNHGVRHGICETNPIRLVRQGAKRKKIPVVLTSEQVRRLLEALAPKREDSRAVGRGYGSAPANPIKAASDGTMLPLVVFVLAFALAVLAIRPEPREAILTFFSAIGDAMLVIVGVIIDLAPIGVFALMLPVASRIGIAAAGALGYYVVVTAVAQVFGILLLYPVAVFMGLECPANSVAEGVRQTGIERAWNGARKEAYA